MLVSTLPPPSFNRDLPKISATLQPSTVFKNFSQLINNWGITLYNGHTKQPKNVWSWIFYAFLFGSVLYAVVLLTKCQWFLKNMDKNKGYEAYKTANSDVASLNSLKN